MDELLELRAAKTGPAQPEGRAPSDHLQRPRRDRITLRASALESLLPSDHRARFL